MNQKEKERKRCLLEVGVQRTPLENNRGVWVKKKRRNAFSQRGISGVTRFMTDAARREQETMKKKATPKLSLSITGGVSRNSTATPPRHTSGNLTPPVTPPITPSSSFRSSTPTGRTGVNRVF